VLAALHSHTLRALPPYRPPPQLVHELGHMLPGEDDSPAKNGAVTFGSFMFFGSLPLWPYILYQLINWDATVPQFGICIGITALCLFFLGCVGGGGKVLQLRGGVCFGHAGRAAVPTAHATLNPRVPAPTLAPLRARPPPSLPLCSATQAAIVRGSKLKLGALMVVNGGLAAGASYLVGWGLTQAVGVNVCG
jgi:VIT1/CCC1 family predicted Fe2+/Mn2+ transporter